MSLVLTLILNRLRPGSIYNQQLTLTGKFNIRLGSSVLRKMRQPANSPVPAARTSAVVMTLLDNKYYPKIQILSAADETSSTMRDK